MDIDLPFLLDLLRIPSVTDDVPQVNRAVAAMRGWLEARGVFCETEAMPDGRELLYASVVEGQRTPKLLLNAHLDVVPASPTLFEPRIEGDRIHGRGTQDCKGNAIAMATALAALAGSGASVGAVFSTDEEEGGETSGEAVARGCRATGLTAVLDAGPWSITYSQKGILSLRLVAKGRGGHHAVLGEGEALSFCRMHGLDEYDCRFVAWLVRNHLEFSQTALRRDISNEEIVQDFAATVGDEEHLKSLYCLTVVDICATNNHEWNEWKVSLFRELYYSTQMALRQGVGHPIYRELQIAENQRYALESLTNTGYEESEVRMLWATFTDDYFCKNSR